MIKLVLGPGFSDEGIDLGFVGEAEAISRVGPFRPLQDECSSADESSPYFACDNY